ncbi:hypothetical protein BpHYR1_039584 [Brachionus plicatilis]|uniref:Uncharacterized protein n=1 Tax=Brachionus plicatilis TaxID=10195 RepID=A0A3M7QM72_BRAPC|nr:hypothetical protein BpHYR1_039584 [Brachionus plicatilis]
MHFGAISYLNHFDNIWKLISRKPFSRIFCSTSFSEKLAITFLTVKLNFITPLIFVLNAFILFLIFVLKKKSFCADRFEIVLNSYFLEAQKYDENSRKPLSNSDFEKLAPFKEYTELLRNIRMKLDGHETNLSWCIAY